MATFITAYLAVWLAVVFYAARLGIRQRRLARALQALEWRIEQSESTGQPPSRAA